MLSHPENVAGDGSLVTDLMAFGEGGIVAKSGAEGLLCLALPERGLGVAIRILDGSFRAHTVIATKVLEELGVLPESLAAALAERHSAEIRNHNGWLVGEIRPAFSLDFK
jgi:L-asparaginase II